MNSSALSVMEVAADKERGGKSRETFQKGSKNVVRFEPKCCIPAGRQHVSIANLDRLKILFIHSLARVK